jgi:hypothetical protein
VSEACGYGWICGNEWKEKKRKDVV